MRQKSHFNQELTMNKLPSANKTPDKKPQPAPQEKKKTGKQIIFFILGWGAIPPKSSKHLLIRFTWMRAIARAGLFTRSCFAWIFTAGLRAISRRHLLLSWRGRIFHFRLLCATAEKCCDDCSQKNFFHKTSVFFTCNRKWKEAQSQIAESL